MQLVIMPITKSAKKKVRVDATRTEVNYRVRRSYKAAVKEVLEKKDAESLTKAYSELDMAAKRNIIHRNKADRLKSRLAKKLVVKS